MASGWKKLAKNLRASEGTSSPWRRRGVGLTVAAALLALFAYTGDQGYHKQEKESRADRNIKGFRLNSNLVDVTYVLSEDVPLYYNAGRHEVRKRVPKGMRLWAIFGQKLVNDSDVWIGILDESQTPQSIEERGERTEWFDLTNGLDDGTIHTLRADEQRQLQTVPVDFQADGHIRYPGSGKDVPNGATSIVMPAGLSDILENT
jgi:hypothetical protein